MSLRTRRRSSQPRRDMADSVYRVTEVVGVSADSSGAGHEDGDRHRRRVRAGPAHRRGDPPGRDHRRRQRRRVPHPPGRVVQVREGRLIVASARAAKALSAFAAVALVVLIAPAGAGAMTTLSPTYYDFGPTAIKSSKTVRFELSTELSPTTRTCLYFSAGSRQGGTAPGLDRDHRMVQPDEQLPGEHAAGRRRSIPAASG